MNNTIKKYIDTYQMRCNLITSDILKFLNHKLDVDVVYDKIRDYYKRLNSEFTYIKDFDINLVLTKSILSEPWYYNPKYYSTKAIEITQNKQTKYIWINEGKWEGEDSTFCLDCESNEGVARELASWTCFDFPKDMKSMISLIKEGYWLLVPQLPKLSEKTLIDTNEVYSWDDKFVLTGTSIKNIDVITIEHWEKIVENEKCYGFMGYNQNDTER